jgi:hypothetical protein
MQEDMDSAFRAELQRNGLAIEPDRYEIMRDAYIGYRQLLTALDDGLPYTAEPGPTWTPGGQA